MVAKFIVTTSGKLTGEYMLDKECMTIGRKPDNDIQIDNLAVSGHHAQVITILNDSFLEDLNSTNGTYVNSKLIKKHALKDSDLITVGKHQLKYVNELASTGAESDFEKTMIIRPDAAGMPESEANTSLDESVGKIGAELAESIRRSEAITNVHKRAKLQILSGANTGKQLDISKALTTLGKPGVAVAAITRRPQGFFIIHVEGNNDEHLPRVNGSPVGTQAEPLSDHDVIDIAGVKMEFSLA
ncbi:MAG: FHA domain-containing protein [Gammaproteobacteria bacterium]